MRCRAAFLSIGCLWLLLSGLPAEARQAETLFEDAKILMFDKNWGAALSKLEELLAGNPRSPLASQALFYKGRCLAELPGREREALDVFKAYLSRKDRGGRLDEDAEIGIIEAAERLYKRGETSRIREVESRLKSSNKVVRYYAAFTLSYMDDRKVAALSVPVLKEIIEGETNIELRDRAKIALLRVSPGDLKALESRRPEREVGRVLKIQVSEKGEMKIDIHIPWALAQLALLAIPEKDKDLLTKKGYDIDRILSELGDSRGGILEIREEHILIKISIAK